MTDTLSATLAQVATALADAREPWWVIGSAAVVLHGGGTTVADVDLLLSRDDAEMLLRRWSLDPLIASDALFGSAVFARTTATPLPVEIMSGLKVRDVAVNLTTREVVAGIAVPARGELIRLLRQFGRPKDLARAALLERLPAT